MVIINIDTSKDSKEEIRQTIKYLQTLVDDVPQESGFSNIFAENESSGTSSEPSESSGGMMGMFDNPFQPSEESSDASSLIDASDTSDDPSDDPEVVDEQEDAFIEIVEYE